MTSLITKGRPPSGRLPTRSSVAGEYKRLKKCEPLSLHVWLLLHIFVLSSLSLSLSIFLYITISIQQSVYVCTSTSSLALTSFSLSHPLTLYLCIYLSIYLSIYFSKTHVIWHLPLRSPGHMCLAASTLNPFTPISTQSWTMMMMMMMTLMINRKPCSMFY